MGEHQKKPTAQTRMESGVEKSKKNNFFIIQPK
jgi:hypothetical protein